MATEKARMNHKIILVVKDKDGKVKSSKEIMQRHGQKSETDLIKNYKEVI